MNPHTHPLTGQFSAAPPARAASQAIFRIGKAIHIDRHGQAVPTHRCFKCNCAAHHEVRKSFSSTGGLLRLLILLQPLLIPFLLPVYLLRRNRVSVAFGLCDDCRERRALGSTIGAALLIASVPFFVSGALTIATVGPVLGFGGGTLLTAGFLTLCHCRHLADSKHVDERWIVLRGGGEPFLATIPQANRLTAS